VVDQPPPGLLATPGFRAGLAVLGRMGLTFDSWVYFTQLGDLTDLARAHPDVTIVSCHFGGLLSKGPYAEQRDEVVARWKAGMSELARCENVVVKLGGIGSPMLIVNPHDDGSPLTPREIVNIWGDVILWCIDEFGPERCMFESNYPVDRTISTYTGLWNAYKSMTAGRYEPGERAALFHDTAARVYRLAGERDRTSPGPTART
jgi:predicted TIM-barrel fold metal-dependent hydrolase